MIRFGPWCWYMRISDNIIEYYGSFVFVDFLENSVVCVLVF